MCRPALCLFAVVLVGVSVVASAADDTLRLSDRMVFRQPDLARPGACVLYREGGSGWFQTEPEYWMKGSVVSAEPRKVTLDICPAIAGKEPEQYSRAEFNRLAKSHPCVAKPENRGEAEFGFIRFKVEDWETPWARRSANTGRLFHGHYLDQKLRKGMELELPAELLMPCTL